MSNDSVPTRSRILAAARDLLLERRGGEVRMSDIARRARVSRQAVYLHFGNRADLLAAVTRDMDRALDVEARLAPSRAAETGQARLAAYIAFWGEYLPHIAPVARALIAMEAQDAEAARAWGVRMQDMREGCAAAIAALVRDGDLAPGWTTEAATDLLWAMLSVETWLRLNEGCGWSAEDYVSRMQAAARGAFVVRR